jgi:Membrane domain of glycerophosphoryl diester phosphodiesterase
MLPIVLVLAAPVAFAQAWVLRDLPTFMEQFRRAQEGTNVSNPYAMFPASYWLVVAAQTLIVTPIVTAALLRLVVGGFLGESWSLSDALRAARRLWLPLAWAVTLMSMATAGLMIAGLMLSSRGTERSDAVQILGGLLTVVGAIVAFVLVYRLMFTTQIVVLEGRRGLGALRRSWEISRGSFWKIFGNMFVVSLLVGIVAGLLSFVPQEIARSNDGGWWLLAALGQTVSLGILMPVLAGTSYLLYVHCRVKREELTLERLEREVSDANWESDGWRTLPPPPGG